MNRIDKKFKELRSLGRKAFIAYITAGDPDLAMTKKIVLALERSGVDIIELGIPFSDPLADGPTIQAASARALKSGASLKKIFKMAGSLRAKTGMPIVFMTYFNPVLRYGVEEFFKSCRASGVDGVIVPDLPPEEASELMALGLARGIDTIFLIAPTSTSERVKRIAKNSKGFIYYVSLTGVTGARSHLPSEVLSRVRYIKSITSKPVAVGFGVSNSSQAREIAKRADGVIVGSAIVKVIEKNCKNSGKMFSEIGGFARSLANAIHDA